MGPLVPTWLRVRQQWLMAVWFWSFCCNCKLVDNSAGHEKTNLAWLAKSASDRKMLSLLVVRSFCLHHINLSRKATFWWKLTFLLVTVVLAKVRHLKLVKGWFSSVFSGLAGQKQIHRQINSFGDGFELVRGLCNSIQRSGKLLHGETRASSRKPGLVGLMFFSFTSAIQCRKMWNGIKHLIENLLL